MAVKLLAPDPKYIDVAAFGDVEQRFKREGQRGAHLRDENLIELSLTRRIRRDPVFMMERCVTPSSSWNTCKGERSSPS